MRQTVRGVASSRPTGPQSQVQKVTATRSATCDTPALWPYNHGSITMKVMSSSTRNRPTTSAGWSHPGTPQAEGKRQEHRDECPDVRDEPKGGRQAPPE